MKLAIICEMPQTEVRRVPLAAIVSVVGHPVLGDGSDVAVQITEPDLSASAEISARDAFAYCQGPFDSMVFMRGKISHHDLLVVADWLLFMAHDCLVDIQAFEAFGALGEDSVNTFRDACFQKWDASGPQRKDSLFRFLNLGIGGPGALTLGERILIEPEVSK